MATDFKKLYEQTIQPLYEAAYQKLYDANAITTADDISTTSMLPSEISESDIKLGAWSDPNVRNAVQQFQQQMAAEGQSVVDYRGDADAEFDPHNIYFNDFGTGDTQFTKMILAQESPELHKSLTESGRVTFNDAGDMKWTGKSGFSKDLNVVAGIARAVALSMLSGGALGELGLLEGLSATQAGAAIGGTSGAFGAALEGKSFKDVLESAATGAATGGALASVNPKVGEVLSKYGVDSETVNKAVSSGLVSTAKTGDITEGLKSGLLSYGQSTIGDYFDSMGPPDVPMSDTSKALDQQAAQQFANDLFSKSDVNLNQTYAAETTNAINQLAELYTNGILNLQDYTSALESLGGATAADFQAIDNLYQAGTGTAITPGDQYSAWDNINVTPESLAQGTTINGRPLSVNDVVVMEGERYRYAGVDAEGSAVLSPAEVIPTDPTVQGMLSQVAEGTPQTYYLKTDPETGQPTMYSATGAKMADGAKLSSVDKIVDVEGLATNGQTQGTPGATYQATMFGGSQNPDGTWNFDVNKVTQPVQDLNNWETPVPIVGNTVDFNVLHDINTDIGVNRPSGYGTNLTGSTADLTSQSTMNDLAILKDAIMQSAPQTTLDNTYVPPTVNPNVTVPPLDLSYQPAPIDLTTPQYPSLDALFGNPPLGSITTSNTPPVIFKPSVSTAGGAGGGTQGGTQGTPQTGQEGTTSSGGNLFEGTPIGSLSRPAGSNPLVGSGLTGGTPATIGGAGGSGQTSGTPGVQGSEGPQQPQGTGGTGGGSGSSGTSGGLLGGLDANSIVGGIFASELSNINSGSTGIPSSPSNVVSGDFKGETSVPGSTIVDTGNILGTEDPFGSTLSEPQDPFSPSFGYDPGPAPIGQPTWDNPSFTDPFDMGGTGGATGPTSGDTTDGTGVGDGVGDTIGQIGDVISNLTNNNMTSNVTNRTTSNVYAPTASISGGGGGGGMFSPQNFEGGIDIPRSQMIAPVQIAQRMNYLAQLLGGR